MVQQRHLCCCQLLLHGQDESILAPQPLLCGQEFACQLVVGGLQLL
jgi:hypothetical protein